MKFNCPLIVVNDINISRKFYEEVLCQKIKYDFGENVVYEGDFSLQLKSHFANMIDIDEKSIKFQSNGFELYFEEDNIEEFLNKLKQNKSINYVHNLLEHPWGQRVIRFYDPDMHIIEVGESMEGVIKRFFNEGMSIDEITKRTQHPLEFVKRVLHYKLT
ncbi:glyoxalase [Clostridium acetobutylicum]|nr:glyoxalase [Clostridium acetobutylicum]